MNDNDTTNITQPPAPTPRDGEPDFFGPPPNLRPGLTVDHETGTMAVPGVGDLPLVGPTSGREYAALKTQEESHKDLMALLAARIHSTYVCIQCRRTYPGARVILHTDPDTQATSLRCPDPTCAAPVMILPPKSGGGR